MCLVKRSQVVHFLAADEDGGLILITYCGLSPKLYLSFTGPSLEDHFLKKIN